MSNLSLDLSGIVDGSTVTASSVKTPLQQIETHLSGAGNVDRDQLQHKYAVDTVPIAVFGYQLNNSSIAPQWVNNGGAFILDTVTLHCLTPGSGTITFQMNDGTSDILTTALSVTTTTPASTSAFDVGTIADAATLTCTFTETASSNASDFFVTITGKRLLST